MRKSLIIFFLLLIFPLHLTFSQPVIDGNWKGTITIMGSGLDIFVKFKTDPDSIRGTIDIPMQGAKDYKLTHISFLHPKVYFELPAGATTAIFDGKFLNDSIKGKFTQASFEGKFFLVRGEQIIEEPVQTEELPYKEEEVSFTNGDNSFAGTLTLPKIEGKHPAVIMITGSGPQNRDEEILGFKVFRIIADQFTRNGIAVLRYDDRGVGGSKGKSTSQSTTEEFAGDVIEAINYLKSRSDINSGQIGLCGHSEGGIIAPMVASRTDDVKFIILIAGTAVMGIDLLKEQSKLIILANKGTKKDVQENNDLLDKVYDAYKTGKGWGEIKKIIKNSVLSSYDKMTKEQKKGIKNVEEYANNMTDMQVEQMQIPWMKYFMPYNPIPALENVKCPVLALFGEKDLQVPPAQNKEPMEKALKKSGNQDYTIVVIPKANHLFQVAVTGSPDEYSKLPKEFAPGFLDTMTEWILKHVTVIK